MEDLPPELQAMASLAAALDKLEDDEARQRVIAWANQKYGGAAPVVRQPKAEAADREESASSAPASFDEFIDLYDKVSPDSNLEKVLTAAYWFQVVNDESAWQSQAINNALKDTGNGIRHITDALQVGQRRNPVLIRQINKSGKTRQARKTYKLTVAGVRFIEMRLGNSSRVELGGDEE